jgi:hypothetical protein
VRGRWLTKRDRQEVGFSMATETTMPPMKASEESTREQLQLGVQQGDAYAKALAGMDKESGADVKRAGEYEVALVVENAEGMWHLESPGNLVWKNPTDENAHVEVAVRDAADGRFIPGLTVHVTLTGPDGTEVGRHEQSFLWHPWLYHYGRNWTVPGEGEYRVKVEIAAPAFMRHDKEHGKRYAEPVEVEFTRKIEPGQKKA